MKNIRIAEGRGRPPRGLRKRARFGMAKRVSIFPITADSLYFLGLLKLYGISVSPDAAKAREYIRKAAEQRHLDAMVALGIMLFHGQGILAYKYSQWIGATVRRREGSSIKALLYVLCFPNMSRHWCSSGNIVDWLTIQRQRRKPSDQ